MEVTGKGGDCRVVVVVGDSGSQSEREGIITEVFLECTSNHYLFKTVKSTAMPKGPPTGPT